MSRTLLKPLRPARCFEF